MIYITGDIHGDPNSRFSTKFFPEQKQMTKEDYVIICGDFGLVWDKEESPKEKWLLDKLDSRNFTTLFVDGNHENFDRLNSYPVEEWHGGKVQKIRPSVIHLMRGEIFNINDLNFFCFGGARSHDIQDGILEKDDPRLKAWKKDFCKMFRVNHISWWKEEIPSEAEMLYGRKNLEGFQNAGGKIDYIITHEAPASTLAVMSGGYYKPDEFSKYLEEVRRDTDFKHWYFGHYHLNYHVNDKESCIFNSMIRIQ
jgi:predicted phosphodiesterase